MTGSLPFPLRRNMVVYRLADGNLLLHSVIAMTDDGMARLDALGKPTVIVLPNGGHRMDVAAYKGRYPGACAVWRHGECCPLRRVADVSVSRWPSRSLRRTRKPCPSQEWGD